MAKVWLCDCYTKTNVVIHAPSPTIYKVLCKPIQVQMNSLEQITFRFLNQFQWTNLLILSFILKCCFVVVCDLMTVICLNNSSNQVVLIEHNKYFLWTYCECRNLIISLDSSLIGWWFLLANTNHTTSIILRNRNKLVMDQIISHIRKPPNHIHYFTCGK